MTTLQIKNKLIRSIKSVQNPEMLEDLYRLLNIEVENIEKLKVPAHVKKSIAKGQKDIKEGKYLTNKQADTEIDQWLKSK
jgi:hypothetical protein